MATKPHLIYRDFNFDVVEHVIYKKNQSLKMFVFGLDRILLVVAFKLSTLRP